MRQSRPCHLPSEYPACVRREGEGERQREFVNQRGVPMRRRNKFIE